ncbi:MAG: hypothetical protein GXP25_13940 [Planctomycetes bacterium]|nr:hypothetical protein [Planctomycetota bacterium]
MRPRPAGYDPNDEDRCRRCGVCCGATDGHPCEHLVRNGKQYRCEIYPYRFGPHKTVTGRHFTCVPVRDVIRTGGGHPGCVYATDE